MSRRALLLAAVLLAMNCAAKAHTPYEQWVVYRKKHLLIGAHRADPQTYSLAKRLATVLASELPKSKCRVARAPNAGRLASLIATGQMDVAVLSTTAAVRMLRGHGPFLPYGPIALRLLARLGDHVLVAHERFPKRHAALVAATLSRAFTSDSQSTSVGIEIDWHSGVALKWRD